MQSNLNLINGQFITLDGNDNHIESITIENGEIKKFNNLLYMINTIVSVAHNTNQHI